MAFSFNLRGTSGSGKTFVARELLELSKAAPCERTSNGRKVLVYEGNFMNRPLYFLGSYETTCGGCDTIPSVHMSANLLEKYFNKDHDSIVFFEGLMISHMLGTVGAMQAELGLDRNYLAFLDTPLDTCLDRVRKRRLDRGDTREFNPDNTTKDWDRVRAARQNAINKGYRVLDVNHRNSVMEVIHYMGDVVESTRD